MLKIIDKKIKIWYQFKSSMCSIMDDCEHWDFDEFSYTISLEDAKDVITYQVAKNIESDNYIDILKALDELDAWECVDWEKIILRCADLIEEYYEMDAMDYYAENKR